MRPVMEKALADCLGVEWEGGERSRIKPVASLQLEPDQMVHTVLFSANNL